MDDDLSNTHILKIEAIPFQLAKIVELLHTTKAPNGLLEKKK